MDSAEDVAFELYRIGTEKLSAESLNCVKPYVVNIHLGKGQINCKMEVGTGASRSTLSISMSMMLNYQIIPSNLWV